MIKVIKNGRIYTFQESVPVGFKSLPQIILENRNVVGSKNCKKWRVNDGFLVDNREELRNDYCVDVTLEIIEKYDNFQAMEISELEDEIVDHENKIAELNVRISLLR